MKFTYRKHTTIYGILLEETATHYIIKSQNDTFSWEKEITICEETPKTNKGIVLTIQKLVADKNIYDMFFQRYFGADRTIKQMLNNVTKDTLQNLFWIVEKR